MLNNQHTGFAIAIAWPETYCKQAGAWYDGLMSLMKISKNNYYKVGHAAVVLINSSTQKCHYFDFGRYHAPYGFGRVRDEITDHDLKLNVNAKIENNNILNVSEILKELLHNPSCHGTGYIDASICAINFENAFNKAKQMQSIGAIKYGPFVYKGTNCSRFVRTTILAGRINRKTHIKLAIPKTISPTPLTNVKALNNRIKMI